MKSLSFLAELYLRIRSKEEESGISGDPQPIDSHLEFCSLALVASSQEHRQRNKTFIIGGNRITSTP